MTTALKEIVIIEDANASVIEVRISGELGKDDYDAFSTALETALHNRSDARILVLLDDFHGWTPGGAWEDFKLGLKHFAEIDRIAVVGEETWEKVITILAKPFTMAEVRYFDKPDELAARRWLAG